MPQTVQTSHQVNQSKQLPMRQENATRRQHPAKEAILPDIKDAVTNGKRRTAESLG